jgi:N-acetylneuraminate lyase
MKDERLDGLVAATYTPLDDDRAVNATIVGPMVEHLLGSGINGFYVCGSTGEGMSLSSDERRAVTEAYVESTDRRVPVIVQVGHNSLAEARQLADER